jgi:hypothetical protein
MTVYAVVQWKDRNGNFASPEQKLSLKALLGEAHYNYIFGVPSTEPRSNPFSSQSDAETFKQETEDNYKQRPTYLASGAQGNPFFEDGRAIAEWIPQIRLVEDPFSELERGGNQLAKKRERRGRGKKVKEK